MISKKAAKIGINFLLVSSVLGEAGAVHKHHQESEHHQQKHNSGGEGGVPPHSTRIERRVEETRRAMEFMIRSIGDQRGQKNGGGDPDPLQNEAEIVRSARSRRGPRLEA